MTSLVFFPQICKFIYEKTSENQIEWHSTKYLTSGFPKCEGTERQGKTEELSEIGGDEGKNYDKQTQSGFLEKKEHYWKNW